MTWRVRFRDKQSPVDSNMLGEAQGAMIVPGRET